jgi:hypothetical protein
MNAAEDKPPTDFEDAVNRIFKAIIQNGVFLSPAGPAGTLISGTSALVQKTF